MNAVKTNKKTRLSKQSLHNQVLWMNQEIKKRDLVPLTWGTASAVDRKQAILVIKPSGVPYADLREKDMVEVSLKTGKVVKGKLQPSIDTEIHRALYNAWPEVGAIVHTHSSYATAFAASGLPIRRLNTTMADYFGGDIPVTGELTKEQIEQSFEENIGNLIVKTLKRLKINPLYVPAVLHRAHGPFVWGATPKKAVDNATVVEEVAVMNWITLNLFPALKITAQTEAMLEYHFKRHNGLLGSKKRSYGQ